MPTDDKEQGSKSPAKTKKKYKLHDAYTTEVDGQESKLAQLNKIEHPELHNDAFWEKKFALVNYRKLFPDAFDQFEFEGFYEWLVNEHGSDKCKERLFKGKKAFSKSDTNLNASQSLNRSKNRNRASSAMGARDESKARNRQRNASDQRVASK